MVKLESQQELLNYYLECYQCYNDNHNQIYDELVNIAKDKYLKGIGVKEFQEQFFIDFIINGKSLNNYDNLYNAKLHKKLLNLRRKINSNFLPGFFYNIKILKFI